MNRQMSDERLDAALRRLLAQEAEVLAAAAVSPEAIAARVGARARPMHPVGLLRLAWLLLLVALLLVTVVAGLLLGRQRPDADDLVRRSMDVHASPPAFVMTVAHDPLVRICSVTRYLYDGTGRFRTECYWDTDEGRPASPEAAAAVQAGAVELPDGLELWQYTIRGGSSPGQMVLDGDPVWVAGARHGQEPQPPATLPHWTVEGLNWHGWWEGETPRAVTCDDWLLGPAATVAGRPARAVECGDARYWIDDASALMVRVELNGEVRGEALALDVGAVPSGLAFGPTSGARLALVEGQPAPDWTLPLADGGELTVSSLHGRPLLAMWPMSCTEPCLDVGDLREVVRANPDLNGIVIVSGPSLDRLEDLRTAAGDIPVVVDDGTRRGWARYAAFAFVAADGTVVGFGEPRSLATLQEATEALLLGRAIPTPPPGDGILVPGEPVPPLSATLVGGARLVADNLAGRPMALLIPPSAPCAFEGDPPAAPGAGLTFDELVTDFGIAHRDLGDRASFVLVGTLASRRTCYSPDSVDWPSILDELRASVGASVDRLLVVDPVGFWTEGENGVLSAAWGGLTNAPTLVVTDADGRLVEIVADGALTGEALDDLDGLIRGAPGG